MRNLLTIAASGAICAGIFAMPASASYMKKCNTLISMWQTCQESGGDCSSQQKKIEAECKCHAQKGDEWKLVNAAVEKDDVCGSPPDDITIPPPPPPPPVIIRRPSEGDGNGGKKEEKKADEKRGGEERHR